MTLYDVIRTWDSWGLTDILLPFILIFTIIFAILQKTKIIGEGKKNYNIGVALVIALLVVVPHITGSYPPNADIVEIINTAIPNVSIVVVAILMVLLLIGTFGASVKIAGTSLATWVIILSVVIIIIIFGAAAGWWGYRSAGGWSFCPGDITNNCWLWWLDDPDTQALVIMILVFGIIVWFITKEDKPKKAGGNVVKKSWDNVGKALKD